MDLDRMQMIEEHLESLRLVRVALRQAKCRYHLEKSSEAKSDCEHLAAEGGTLLRVLEKAQEEVAG